MASLVSPSCGLDVYKCLDVQVPYRWHLENGILLNPSKSEALITGRRHQTQFFDTTQCLCIAGSTVSFVNNISFFGVTVDNHLSFDQHVSDIVRYPIKISVYIMCIILHNVHITTPEL